MLIVLNPDGTIKGAHQESLRTIMDGDTQISVTMVPANAQVDQLFIAAAATTG